MFEMVNVSGPHGDETCGYRIMLHKEYTVSEFIAAVLEKYPNDWGDKVYLGFCDWIKTLPYSELITGEFGNGEFEK